MKIGFHLPQWGVAATRRGVLGVARAIEEAGLDSVWVADHLVHPIGASSEYPYAERTPFGPDDGFLEALTVLAAVSSVTERVTLGTSALVLPMRETLLAAKSLSAIDVLSGGRVVIAVGAGWLREEFEALGAPFERRGKRLDEQVQALRRLWTQGHADFAGDHVRFGEVVCEPRPVQPGGPPILIGGMGPGALRRAGTLGDGWHAVGAHTDTLGAGRDQVVAHAERAGRDPVRLTFSTTTALPADDDGALRRLDRLSAFGLDHVVLDLGPASLDEARAKIEQFAERVLPKLRDRTND
jgi:probable F420-dependent oxidoreductase